MSIERSVSKIVDATLAAQLKHRVTLVREVISSDTLGGGVVSFEDVATVWASVQPISAQDTTLERGIEAVVTYRIQLRYRNDITPDLRIVWQGQTLTITAIMDVAARGAVLEILARTGGIA